MSGTITSIENYGTIVVVWLYAEAQSHPVYFDHRPYAHLLQSEGCGSKDLIGRLASYDNGTFTFRD